MHNGNFEAELSGYFLSFKVHKCMGSAHEFLKLSSLDEDKVFEWVNVCRICGQIEYGPYKNKVVKQEN
jgi:hypothetical protein